MYSYGPPLYLHDALPVEKAGPGLGELVQTELAACNHGQDSEKAGAGGWLQHAVGRRDTRSGQRGNAERKRRRKLLEGLALLRSACVGGKKVGDLCQHGRGCGRSFGRAEERRCGEEGVSQWISRWVPYD